jgi:hypothetical protein
LRLSRLTGSIGFLSDALESGANIVAAVITLVALTYRRAAAGPRPCLSGTKAEYLSSGAEGFAHSWWRPYSSPFRRSSACSNPEPLAQVGLGVARVSRGRSG